jgi:hypothetical protein
MIRNATTKDITSIATFLSNKLSLSLNDAVKKSRKIVKNYSPSFLKEEKDLSGVCWVENRIVNNVPQKFVEIHVKNWRLAEDFIQCLKWSLNGEYMFLIPRKDMLNRTYNKAGIKYLKIEGDNHLYSYRFEKREFRNYKSEDLED